MKLFLQNIAARISAFCERFKPKHKKHEFPPEYTQFRIMWQEKPNLYAYMLFGWNSNENRWVYLNVTSNFDLVTHWTVDYNCKSPIISDMADHVSVFCPALTPRNKPSELLTT
jgi:hypothetical protein